MAVWKNNRKFAIGKQRLGIMVETNDRKLPVGIQSFEEIRKGGYLYVDKTDIIWQLANKGKTYNYLIRPRRFGKSVLVDTLEAYFMGKKELFEGLKIMQMETECKELKKTHINWAVEDHADGDGMGEATCHQTGYESCRRRAGNIALLSQ